MALAFLDLQGVDQRVQSSRHSFEPHCDYSHHAGIRWDKEGDDTLINEWWYVVL